MNATPAEQLIAARLKSARKLAGLNQKELAAKLEVSPQQIQKYESGENRISAGRLWQVAEVLGLQPSYFFHKGDLKTGMGIAGSGAGGKPSSGAQTGKIRQIATLLEEVDDDEVVDAILTLTEGYLASKHQG